MTAFLGAPMATGAATAVKRMGIAIFNNLLMVYLNYILKFISQTKLIIPYTSVIGEVLAIHFEILYLYLIHILGEKSIHR